MKRFITLLIAVIIASSMIACAFDIKGKIAKDGVSMTVEAGKIESE